MRRIIERAVHVTSITSKSQGDLSASDSPDFTMFDVETAGRLTRDHIMRLAVGVSGAVLIKGFSSRQDCDDIMAALETCELGAYDEQVITPRIAKLGPAVNDLYSSGQLNEHYWEHCAQALRTRSTLLRGTDPMELAVGRLREAWGGEVQPARTAGKPMYAGLIREMSQGSRIHFDEITREYPGTLDETPASFLTFNWYLSMPAGGGETSVFRHRWRPADEQYRDGYGYLAGAVDGEPAATMTPEAGDAAIFDARNLHVVRPGRGAGRRVTVSFFLGITGRGPLEIWS
jgi:2OG-Fe(II) oxygenase superfamily